MFREKEKIIWEELALYPGPLSLQAATRTTRLSGGPKNYRTASSLLFYFLMFGSTESDCHKEAATIARMGR